ncbi:DMT family transporter [Calidifontibacillus oryziterrae]|uniref:DMT family transporter n=1 Tax=Calidifontibacillus oryziterrae TaxID=1191699 RepID=UPI0002F29104|nr:DMT family transporter [Calidifontibacillus oryziterrae]
MSSSFQAEAYIKIAVAMAIVGSSVVVGKLIVSSFPIFIASELRFVIAVIILIPLLLRQERRFPVIDKKHLIIMFLQAFTGIFLFNVFMLYGLKYTTAMEAGIIMSTLPAVVGIVAYIFLREKMTIHQGVGILFAVFGVLVMTFVGGKIGDSYSWFGNLLVFGAVLGETFFITLGKFVSNQLSPLVITTMVSIFGLIMFLPFALIEAKDFNFSSVGVGDWLNILYFGIVVTIVAFLLMYQGLAKVPASSAGVLTSMLPVSSTILSFLILKESITSSHFIGIFLVIVAIFLISRDGSEREKSQDLSRTS